MEGPKLTPDDVEKLVTVFKQLKLGSSNPRNDLDKLVGKESLPEIFDRKRFAGYPKEKIALVQFLLQSSNYTMSVVAHCFSTFEAQTGINPGDITTKEELARYVVMLKPDGLSTPLHEVLRSLQGSVFRSYGDFVLSIQGDEPASIVGKDVYEVFAKAMEQPIFNVLKDPISKNIRVRAGKDNEHIMVEGIEMSVEKWVVVKSGLVTFQQLQALLLQSAIVVALSDPKDFASLLQCGYRSPLSIAQAGKEQSEKCMKDHGIPPEKAQWIYNKARLLVSYGEGVLLDALLGRGTQSNQGHTETSHKVSPPLATEISLNSVFSFESMGCEECASATGPAAYYVSLLHTLQTITVNIDENKKQTTLRDHLFGRRPDLEVLELSCANTNVLIPYIDLVNEVLEAVLWYTKDQPHGPLRVPSFNMDAGDATDSHIARPSNTNFNVYREVVKKVVYPLDIFPYNQAIHSIRAYLKALGVSRYALLEKFQSPHLVSEVLKKCTLPEEEKDNEAQAALGHAMAAEVLGLQQEDFVIITRESFYSSKCIPDNSKPYEQWIGYQGVDKFWGFNDTAEMTGPTGLTLINKQLLPRSGLNFGDLLILLKTKYLNRSLVIESTQPKDRGPQFTGQLEDMRLRRLTSNGKTADLDEDSCDQLQCFLRLRGKLGWSIQELDTVISTLIPDRVKRFSPQVLDDLAAIKQLAETTGQSPTELQPLWGDINTHGENSLYARLFLKRSMDTKEHRLFLDLAYGEMAIPEDPRISTHSYGIAAALGITEADVLQAVEPTGNIQDELSLANISALYRRFLLCKILSASPVIFPKILSLFPGYDDPFKDARTTLRMIREACAPSWDPDPLTLEELYEMIQPTSDTEQAGSKRGIETTRSIRSSLVKAELSGNASEIIAKEMASGNRGRLIAEISRTHDGQALAKYFSGTPLDQNEDREAIKRYLTPLIGAKETNSFISNLLGEPPAEDSKALMVKILRELLTATLKEKRLKCILTFLKSYLPEAGVELLRWVVCDLLPLSNLDPWTESVLQINSFKGYFLPPITAEYIIETTSTQSPKLVLDENTLEFKGDTMQTVTSKPLLEGRWYKIEYPNQMAELKWKVAKAPDTAFIQFDADRLVSESSVAATDSVTDIVAPLAAVSKRLAISIPELRFWQNNKIFNFSKLHFMDVRQLEQYYFLREIFQRNGSKVLLLDLYKWLYLPSQDRKGDLAMMLSRVTAWSLAMCTSFMNAKYPPSKVSEDARIDMFKKITTLFEMREAFVLIQKLNFPGAMFGALISMAVPATPWETDAVEFRDADRLRAAMEKKFSAAGNGGRATPFSTASDEIRNRQREALIQALMQQEYARAQGLTDTDKLFGHFLIDVQMGPVLQTSRIKQAIATVQLFIQRWMLGKEADFTSEAFKALQTKVDPANLFHYRLWEANRKATLYPENWIDPSLRDDKSEQFQEFESTLMQAKLDNESITALVREYVHSINDIANLQIESYLCQRNIEPEKDDYVIHFFGRTRHAPFVFYYRKMRLHHADKNANPTPHWWPWTKMDVDIPVPLADAEGKRLKEPGSHIIPAICNDRLCLFLPEIIIGQEAASHSPGEGSLTGLTEKKIFEGKPKRHWEIRMGFTELRDGKWLPKTTSPLKIDFEPKTQDEPMPCISEFRFLTPKTDNGIAIWVELPGEKRYLGGFVMKDRQLALAAPAEVQYQAIRPTAFGKFTFNATVYVLPFDPSNTGTLAPFVMDGPNNGQRLQLTSKASWSPKSSEASLPGPLSRDPETNIRMRNEREALLADIARIKATYDMMVSKAPLESVFTVIGMLEGARDYDNRLNQEIEGAKELLVTEPANSQGLLNRAAPKIMQRMAKSGGLQAIYACIRDDFAEMRNEVFGRLSDNYIFSETTTPSAIYMWELAVHIPSLLLERLIATQQLDLALTVARLVFDPTRPGKTIERCWSFPPFQDEKLRQGGTTATPGSELAMEERREAKDNVHAAARGKPVAYMKRIAMKYIETLVAAGDDYFRENTLESIPFAIQRYTEASHVYGPAPVEIGRLGKRTVKSYREITDLETKVYMELDIPFYSERHTVTESIEALGFIFTGYFCVAANPAMVSLRTLIDDRLYKIRNGMDINGNKQRLPLFEPPIDPGAVVRANAGVGGMSVAGFLAGLQSPMPNYRFRYLLQRALELVQDLKMLGQELLSIREKKDTEALSLLRHQHQNSLLVLMKSIKERQKREVDDSIATLQAARTQQKMRIQFYLSLTGDSKQVPELGEQWQDIVPAVDKPTPDQFRSSKYEQNEIDKATSANGKTQDARTAAATAAVFFALPTGTMEVEPWGVGMSLSYGGAELGQAAATLSSVKQIDAQLAADQGQQAARRAALVRQLQERRMEINMAGHQLMKIDGEIKELDARKTTWDAEINAQEEAIQNSAAEEAWLRSKFTSQQLYTMLDNSIGTLYHATYLLASEMAQIAQRALDFEHALRYPNSATRRKEMTPGLIGYWDDSRHGQLAGEALYLDLKRMEMIHMENQTHDFEITKTVSLRQVNPLALLSLQGKGEAEFELPEVLFDMDYPGHYCRRISSVAVSIPCILGAYSSFSCTLTLTGHKYRISPLVDKVENYAPQDGTNFRTDRVPIQSIAVSNGIQDSGMFDLNFRGHDKYGPFEGAGAISTWNIKLPEKLRQFDYDTITDIMLHFQYTALAGGDKLAQVATESASNYLKNNKNERKSAPLVLIDLGNDYPDQWHRRASTGKMVLARLHDRLPYWMREFTVHADGIHLFSSKALSNAPKISTKQTEKPAELTTRNSLGNYNEFSTTLSPALQVGNDNNWTLEIDEKDIGRVWLLIRCYAS